MTKHPYEYEMSEPVSDWIRSQGMRVYAEVRVQGADIDLVGIEGFSPGHIVHSIELKRNFSASAFGQASYHAHKCHYCYIAAFSYPSKQTMENAKEFGIGLLTPAAGKVRLVLAPKRNKILRRPLYVNRAHQGGVGGKATSLGPGPAAQVYDNAMAYRDEHPGCSWDEIYFAVPNHYAHSKSMYCAMRTVAKKHGQKAK